MKFDENGEPMMADQPRTFGSYARGVLDSVKEPVNHPERFIPYGGESIGGLAVRKTADAFFESDKQKNAPYEGPSGGIYDQVSVFGRFDETPPPATEEMIQDGGVLTPPPDASPGEKINAMNENRSRGFGNYTGQVKRPPMPTPREQADRIQMEQGKQMLFDQTKVPEWHTSDSFYSGLLSFGLNLLAGNDVATAFNAAGQTFETNFGREKRTAWAEDLRAAGYDDQEIMKYIETGDNKVLTDPMEKQRQARRDALAEAQLRKAEWESDPNRLQWKDEMEVWDIENRLAQQDFSNQMAINQLNLQAANKDLDRELKQLQIQAAREKLAGGSGSGGKVQPRDSMLAVQQMSADLDKANRPLSMVGAGFASAAKGLFGQEYGSDLAYSDPWFFPGSVKESQETRNAQNQFIDNGLRLATGAVAKENEMAQYRAYLFPQGKEFNDPQIVARKKATQDFFNQTARNIALGKTKEMDPAIVSQTMKAISTGKAQVLKNPKTGEIVGYRDIATGYIHSF